jgi:RNA polymerase sigma-70 factor, ECF subfamily
MTQDLEQLIEGCKKADPQAQRRMYKYCFEQMMRVCLRYHSNEQDAANCYNEAMFNVLSKINSYKNEGQFMGWVRRIMVNTCINLINRDKRFAYTEITETHQGETYTNPEVYQNTDARELLAMVQELPRQTALVFNLYIMEGYTHEQISEMLQIPSGTSRWHLNKGRNLLKERMTNKMTNENFKNA